MIDLTVPEATLLLVDDRPENLRALVAVLEPLGHRLVTAHSGEEALKRLLTDDVSVIVLDVRMPGMDGFETATHIKSRERTREIPIIFLTALDAEAAEILAGFSSGAVDYMTKPVDPALMRAKVQVFVELAQKTELLRRQSDVLSRRLDERLTAETNHLRRLADAALAINSTLSLDDMLRTINDSARDVIGANVAETLITNRANLASREQSRSYSAKYEAWASQPAEGEPPSVWSMVIERQRPVRMTKKQIDDSLTGRGVVGVAGGHPMLEGWMAAPLLARTGRTLGLIQVSDKVEGDFSEDDELVLTQLAQLAAVAIENAEQFAIEHAIAETLQRSMLPARLPDVPGLMLGARYVAGGAGTQVGGDWYDVVPLDDGRVILSVGDVVGRGAQAAAVMGQLRTAMRAYSLMQLPATVIMRSLDRLLQDVTESSLATAACLVVDPSDGRTEIVLAGHPPPLVLAADGTASFLTCDPHTPLGVIASPVYAVTMARLEPGSTIVLFTDGLVESPDMPVEVGMEHARAALEAITPAASLEDLCDRLLSSVDAEQHRDDVALLAARLG